MKLIKPLYLNNRLFQCVIALIVLFIISFFFPAFLVVPELLFLIFVSLIFTDFILLFRIKKGIHGVRFTPEKLSNGDQNELRIYIENYYAFPVSLRVIDEIPDQFQLRDTSFFLQLSKREKHTIVYNLRPVKRGEYSFGGVNVFVSTQLGLIARRFRFSEDKVVPVYPSYIQMRKYEIMAISNNLVELGIKKIRRIGHNMEFEQVKEYVSGDDYRTINWKATARKGELMVNNYQDEKSQQVYSIIDKSRVMQMPFDGMSLLDYPINASLVISNIAIRKEDKAGLITFQHKLGALVPASRRAKQMQLILETLYNQKTAYKEADYSKLYSTVKRKINQRSLLLLFTNFETITGMHRQLPYLKKMARDHLLVVVFFHNTELKELLETTAKKTKQVYNKAIAEKLSYEKTLIVKELANHGIHSILTTPEHLTVNTINKYLELKARGFI